MKQKRNIVVLFAILLVLIIIYASLNSWNHAKKEKEEAKKAESTIKLVDADSLTGIQYTNGESTMSFVKEDGAWYFEDDRDVSLNQDTIEELAKTVTGLSAERELENPDELSDYGLTKPAYTVWYTTEKGTIPIYIGNMAGENYYATVGDTGKVYTITDDLVYEMSFDIDDYVITS